MTDDHPEHDGPPTGRADIPSTYERPKVNPGIFIAIACVAVVVGAAVLGIAMSGS